MSARGEALLRAVEVVEALRGPGGDAWTHQQTHTSLARYLLEESHEVLEAIDDPVTHGPAALVDELGDLLFQVLLHARLGEEEDPAWDIDDVARSFIAKMERRNPHIFAERRDGVLEDAGDVDEIIAQWHAVKAAERAAAGRAAEPTGPARWFDGLPRELPALQTAAKAVHRARSAGELDALLAAADDDGDELARTLLDLVAAAEARDVDPETALRGMLARIRGGGRDLSRGGSD